MLGISFLKSGEMAEEMHAAMCCRGFTGEYKQKTEIYVMCSGYFQHFYYGRMYCIVLVSEPKDIMIDRKRQKRAVMIRLENVCFAYEKEIALRYVDLHINRGDSIVIQGPNGCGKSTLIKLLNGIIFHRKENILSGK